MSNTIIVGDVAEGQKWFGEAEFLKQQLVNTYKNTNPNMSTWKQVTADVKIYVKMVNGVAQAFIYTEGGLFVTLEDFETPESTDYIFYKDNITNPIKKKYKTGTTSYWYSTDKKECISWTWTSTNTSSSTRIDRGTALIYVKGVEFFIGTSVMCAAIRKGIIVILTFENREFILKTYKIIAGVLTLQTSSNLLIDPNQSITRYYPNTFEFDKDISIVVFLKAVSSVLGAFFVHPKVCKISVSSDYLLVVETEVFGPEDPVTSEDTTHINTVNKVYTEASYTLPANNGGYPDYKPVPERTIYYTTAINGSVNTTRLTITTTNNNPLARGAIILGKLVGRLYYYLYAENSVNGTTNTSRSGTYTGTLNLSQATFDPIQGEFVGNSWWDDGISTTVNTTEEKTYIGALKVGVVDLDTSINVSNLYTVLQETWNEAGSNQTSHSASSTGEGASKVTSVNDSRTWSYSTVDINYTVKAFYPEKKVCLIHRRHSETFTNQTTENETIYNSLILLKNNTVITSALKTGLTSEEIYNLYNYIPTTLASYTKVNAPNESGIAPPELISSTDWGSYYNDNHGPLNRTQEDTFHDDLPYTGGLDLDNALNFSENQDLLVSSALLYQRAYGDNSDQDKLLNVVLDIDKNELLISQTAIEPVGSSAVLVPSCSTTT